MKQGFSLVHFWGIVSCLIFSIGCSRTALEYSNAPIITHSNNPLSLQQVGNQISQAGAKIGWTMDSTQSGEIIGTFKSPKYSVTVFIPYSSKSYSILYRQSHGLKYKEDAIFYGKKIHFRYNQLIKKLHSAIEQELLKTPPNIPAEVFREVPASPQEPPANLKEPTSMKDLEEWLREKEQKSNSPSGASSGLSK